MSKCKFGLLQMHEPYWKCKQLHLHQPYKNAIAGYRLRVAVTTVEQALSIHIGVVRMIDLWATQQREGRHHA
jgi:hypothetical protein